MPARIVSVDVSVHSVPFDGVAVRQGVGECHHGLNPTAVAEVVRYSMAGTLIGCDPHDVECIWARIYNHQIRTHGLGAGSVIALSGQAFRDLFEARAIAIAQADCTKAGGISEAKKIMDMAAAYHMLAASHTSQSVISMAANVHLLCALSNALIYEADISAHNPWRDDLAPNSLRVVNGHIEPNDAPGLGITLDEAVLAKYPAIPGPCYVPPWWQN